MPVLVGSETGGSAAVGGHASVGFDRLTGFARPGWAKRADGMAQLPDLRL